MRGAERNHDKPDVTYQVLRDSGVSRPVTDARHTIEASATGSMDPRSCLYEGPSMPSICSVCCAPIPSRGLFGACNSSNPGYVCR